MSKYESNLLITFRVFCECGGQHEIIEQTGYNIFDLIKDTEIKISDTFETVFEFQKPEKLMFSLN